MSAAVPYIGSKISLISKSEIRYEGILYTIDTKESTVALQNVRSFGTEGRKKEGDQIPPSNEVYDYIIFRGADIKDLHVVETPPQPPVSSSRPHDPAIISMQNPATMPHSNPNQGYPYPNYQYGPMSNPQFQMGPWGYGMPPNQYYASFAPQTQLGTGQQNPQVTAQNQNRPQQPPQQPQQSQQTPQDKKQQPAQSTPEQKPQPQPVQEPPKPAKAPEPAQTQPQPQPQVESQPTPQQSQQSAPEPVQNGENSTGQHHQRPSNRGRGGNQRGRYNQGDNRGGRGGGQRRPNSGNRQASSGGKTLDEFDLEASNARFEKDKILSEVAAQAEANADKAYDKTSSFFDNISCEATDRMKEKTAEKRKTDTDMRRLDAETFGMERLNVRGRGGYRGGRGGGQRRYGYNQNQNQNQRDNRQNNQSNSNSSHQKQVFRPVSGGSPGNGRDNRNRSENKQ